MGELNLFLARWFGMVGVGIFGIRMWVVRRLRAVAGGVESRALTIGKSVVDAITLGIVFAAALFFIAALGDLSA